MILRNDVYQVNIYKIFHFQHLFSHLSDNISIAFHWHQFVYITLGKIFEILKTRIQHNLASYYSLPKEFIVRAVIKRDGFKKSHMRSQVRWFSNLFIFIYLRMKLN